MGDEERGRSTIASTASSVGVSGFRTFATDTPFFRKVRNHRAACFSYGSMGSANSVSKKEAVGAKDRLILCKLQADLLAPVHLNFDGNTLCVPEYSVIAITD
jgi:hypothetical protein